MLMFGSSSRGICYGYGRPSTSMAEELCEVEELASMRYWCEIGPGPRMIAHEDRCDADLTIDLIQCRILGLAVVLFTPH